MESQTERQIRIFVLSALTGYAHEVGRCDFQRFWVKPVLFVNLSRFVFQKRYPTSGEETCVYYVFKCSPYLNFIFLPVFNHSPLLGVSNRRDGGISLRGFMYTRVHKYIFAHSDLHTLHFRFSFVKKLPCYRRDTLSAYISVPSASRTSVTMSQPSEATDRLNKFTYAT